MNRNALTAIVSKKLVRFFLFFVCFFSFFVPRADAQTVSKIWDFSDPKVAPLAIPFAAPGGVAAAVDIKVEKSALRFLNRAGGSFGARFLVTPFDAEEFPNLTFDYSRSDDAKINWFFKVNGAYYGVVFSGPPRVRAGSFLLGTVPGVGLKGRATLPLRDWLRRFQPRAEKLVVEEILAGNWDNEGYLLAGIGGNGPGANWSLSRFSLLAAPPKTPLKLGKPGFEGNRIVWPIESGALDTRSAVLAIGDQKWDFSSPFLRLETGFDAQNRTVSRLVFEAGDAGLQLQDGQTLNLSLAGETATLGFNAGSHGGNVPFPRLDWDGISVPGADFETDLGGWSGVNATAELDSQNPFGGQNSARFTNPRTASTFDSTLAGAPFDAALLPVISFAYRADTRLRLDFRLVWEAKPYSIRFFDRDGAQPQLGTIDGALADEKWHLAQIPLLDWMKKKRPDATNFKIDSFGVADDAWLGNVRGVSFNLDEFRFAPLLKDTLRAKISLRDLSGVEAVSYAIDQNSETVPDRTGEGGPKLEISLAGRAAGTWWLHVRAQNGAGNWSDAAHFPFVVG